MTFATLRCKKSQEGDLRLRGLLPLLAMASVALTACNNSPTLSNGVNLSRVGQAAAGQMQQNVTFTSGQYSLLKAAVTFDAAFSGDANNPRTSDFLQKEAQIRSKLSAYAGMLGQLAGAYVVLGELAGFDASGSFSSSIGMLCSSGNVLLAALNSVRQIPANACTDLTVGGGFVISAIQAQQVGTASDQIETVLKTLIPVLADSTTRTLIMLNGELVERQIISTTRELYASGVYTCSPLLDQLGAPLGLKTIGGVDAVVRNNRNVRNGCLASVQASAKETAGAVSAAYDASVAGLKALIPLHDSLRAGAPLDLTSISAIIANLQALAAKLQPPTR
jgi:hypothetical protein